MTRAAIITSGAVQQHLSGTMALWTRPVLLIILALLGGIGMVAPARAAECTPLLMQGKSTLYQRVLTRPGASLHAEPAETAPMFGADLPPLSVFFVYDRRSAGGAEWLAIGRTSRGRPDGWIRADTAIDWRQTLTVTFTPPINRDRALFFHDRRDLVATVKSADPSGAVKEYYADIDTGTLPANGSIVSIEPDKPVDMLRNFYLLPILDHGEVNFKRGLDRST